MWYIYRMVLPLKDAKNLPFGWFCVEFSEPKTQGSKVNNSVQMRFSPSVYTDEIALFARD
jgi:hypothetical protein